VARLSDDAQKGVRFRVQAACAFLVWAIAAVLPAGAASKAGGQILVWLGPRQRKHRHILRNLSIAHPHLDEVGLRRLAREVWRNFGSVLFEFPHLQEIYASRVVLRIAPEVQRLLREGHPFAVMTAHLANWELLAFFLADRCRHMTVVYGPQENDLLNALVQRFRNRSPSTWVPKQDALRRITRDALAGGSVGFLPDVRVDTGTMMPLFDVPAPTTISPARLALRLRYPLVPARVCRIGAARFELQFLAPLNPEPGTVGKLAAVSLTRQYNELLETWIRERPGEWFCTKRRWPKTAYGPG